MRPHIAARIVEDNVSALSNTIPGHDFCKLRDRRHHEGHRVIVVRKVLEYVGEFTAWNVALHPGITATGDTEPIRITGKQDGTIQDAQSGIVEISLEPSRFDQILRIDERHEAPPCGSLPYADELTLDDQASVGSVRLLCPL